MATSEFDKMFQKLISEMVEIAFEYVGRNKFEVDGIYIYASMEEGDYFFNVFFNINGKLIDNHKINEVSVQKYDDSDARAFAMLRLGTKSLREVSKLFKEDNREVPSLMKMVYSPKTGAFTNDIIYELQYSNDPERTNVDGFQEWFEEIEHTTV
jgi:hypothetical protein